MVRSFGASMSRAPKIAKAQGRSVREWVGSSPDAKVPPTVKLRILRRANHTCALSGIKIADGQTFDLEHVRSLEDFPDGHRESNLVPVLRLPHELKTAAEKKRQAKADRIAKAAHGMKSQKSRPIQSAGFPPPEDKKRSDRAAKVNKGELPELPRRRLFA